MDEAILAYNSSIHSTTGLAFFEFITVHYTNIGNNILKPTNVETGQEYLNNHINNYKKLAEIVYNKTLNSKKKLIDMQNINRLD